MKSGQIIFVCVFNLKYVIFDNFGKIVFSVVSGFESLVEDIVFIRWIGEYIGILVIIFFNIQFYYWKLDNSIGSGMK